MIRAFGLNAVSAAKAGDVEIYVPRDFYLSFFSSPYTPHLLGRAVDVSTSTEFGDEFYSPVSGKVVKVVKIYSGLGPYSESDYVIFLKHMNYYVKLMHVEPVVRVGDSLYLGDVVGRYLRSNYFSYHHLPHAHVEVLKHLTLRPTRSLRVRVSDELLDGFGDVSESDVGGRGLELEVVKVCKGYYLCRASTRPIALAGGVPVIPQGELGVGVGYLGLIHLGSKPSILSEVRFSGIKVGYTLRVRDWYSLLGTEKMSSRDWFSRMTSISNILSGRGWEGVDVYVNGVKVRGVELLLSSLCDVKVVGDLDLRPGDRVMLRLQSGQGGHV